MNSTSEVLTHGPTRSLTSHHHRATGREQRAGRLLSAEQRHGTTAQQLLRAPTKPSAPEAAAALLLARRHHRRRRAEERQRDHPARLPRGVRLRRRVIGFPGTAAVCSDSNSANVKSSSVESVDVLDAVLLNL